jgi:hypothetical protein
MGVSVFVCLVVVVVANVIARVNVSVRASVRVVGVGVEASWETRRCAGGAVRSSAGIVVLGGRGGVVFGRGGGPLLFVGSSVGLRGVWVRGYVRRKRGICRGHFLVSKRDA